MGRYEGGDRTGESKLESLGLDYEVIVVDDGVKIDEKGLSAC